MLTFLQTIAVAFSMFSAIPVPQFPWTTRNMRYALAAFPLVGVVIGLLAWAWIAISDAIGFGMPLFAAGLTLIPVALSGGIHLDGLADTTDALASHADREKRLQIMDDPHTGAFATIALVCYLLLYFALCCELTSTPHLALCLSCLYVLCRSTSAIGVTCFKSAKGSGLAHQFQKDADRRGVTILASLVSLACIAVLIVAGGAPGMGMSAGVLLMLAVYRALSSRMFGGITGDLSGWFLQWAELAGIAAFVLVQSIV